MIDRRAVMGGLAGLATYGLLAGCGAAQLTLAGAPRQRLGVQLVTVRSDLHGTPTRLRGFGYETLELPDFMGRPARELRPAADLAFAQDPASVGRGVIEWGALMPAAAAAGMRGYFVEQEPPYPAGPLAPLEERPAYLLASYFRRWRGLKARLLAW